MIKTPCLDDKGRAAGNVVRIQGIVSGERLLGDALLGLWLVHRQQGVHRVLPPLRGRQRVLLTLPAQRIRVVRTSVPESGSFLQQAKQFRLLNDLLILKTDVNVHTVR
jgi:hypothetical protein